VKLANFDRASLIVLGSVLVFSAGVAVTSWEWFPTDDWNDIASIPPNALNYAALLLPWLTLLAYSVVRRRLIDKREEPDD
jgi:hypothetical protein